MDVLHKLVAPECPVCHHTMNAARREAQRANAPLRVGSPVPPRLSLPVWRCPDCGIDAPRLDDAA